MINMYRLAFCILLFFASPVFAFANFTIDTAFPGGNVEVIKTDGDTVTLKPDLRDTDGYWFYWAFRVRGAEGKTLHFVFENPAIDQRGPAVSTDRRKTWRWLSNEANADAKTFSYTFGADEKETYFSHTFGYTDEHLQRFLDKYKNNPHLKIETLCKSRKGRNVELLRIVNDRAKYRVFLSARHHSGETMGSYVLEGIIAAVLSDQWLQQNCDFFIVPFVDKDGVEDGDQGKNRKPHDHNRDYIQRIYPEVKAITEQVPHWLEGKPVFWLDIHCPYLRDERCFYFTGQRASHEIEEATKRFSAILEKERKGALPFKAGTETIWDVTSPDLEANDHWGTRQANVLFAKTVEVPFATAGGIEVNAASARQLGGDLANAMREFLKTKPFVIDTAFPGGNVEVVKIDGDTVTLKPDLRDTDGYWFYWAFRVRGAEGKTLHFVFENPAIDQRGPAVSTDGRKTWRWLSNEANADAKTFSYTFGADEKETYFSHTFGYTDEHLQRFLDKYKNNPHLKIETLCKSRKGRNVDVLLIANNKAKYQVYLCARHHSGETIGSYVLEGLLGTILSDSELGQWLRRNSDFMVVPMVDKDGVEDGDQGKNRKPHDHSLDYVQRTYPEVKAVTERLNNWLTGKPLFWLDLHDPYLRDNRIYCAGVEGKNKQQMWNAIERFSDILERESKTFPFHKSDNIPFGSGWNKGWGEGRQCSSDFAGTLPQCVFSTGIEISFADIKGKEVNAATARQFGGDLANAMREFLETLSSEQ